MTEENNRFQDICRLCIMALLLLILSTALSSRGYANEAQQYICHAGLGLGQAQSRLELFGRAFNGAIPADQLSAIATNLANASAAISLAEERFNEPFAIRRKSSQYGQNAMTKIGNYNSQTSGMSYSHKANYIQNIYGSYRNSLEYTYVSSRGAPFEWKPTCDSLILKACYYFGRATTASVVEGHFASSYQSSAIGSMWDAIESGLAIAMDSGHKPYDGHAKKICCTFGSPVKWNEVMTNVKQNSKHHIYRKYEQIILVLVGSAMQLDPVCNSSKHPICASGRVHDRGPVTGRFAGTWRCDIGNATLKIVQNGSVISGSWSAEGDTVSINGNTTGNNISFRWQYGGTWADYNAALSADQRSMRGNMELNLEGWGRGSEPFSCSR